MTREQYNFCNMYWEDPEWTFDDNGIPKEAFLTEDGKIYFQYLSPEETKMFIKIKTKEEPEMLKDIRIKKLKRINEV